MAKKTTPSKGGASGKKKPTGNSPGKQKRTFTQEELNREISKRLKSERAKNKSLRAKAALVDERADYDDIKAERDKLAKQRKKLARQIKHKNRLEKVADKTGIPQKLIHGESKEEMFASAEAVSAYVKALKPKHPEDKGGGASAKPVTRESILAIKDDEKRVKAIANNIELFD